MAEWTLVHKKKILDILNEFGAGNYDLIHQHMPEKSVAEIKAFCENYIERATKRWERSRASEDDGALKNWLDIMNRVNKAQTGSLTDILPRVLKYIALFEKRKENSCINLSDCYMVLSDLSAGLPSKRIDETNSYFFYECLLRLARSVKEDGNGSSINYLKYLTNLKIFLKNQGGVQKKAKTNEFSSVLNPLSVPYNLLQMTPSEKRVMLFD